MNLITAHVRIGKSKNIVEYFFLIKDFIRIENSYLIIKDEHRRLKIDEETQRQIIYQINLEN
jgi:hypothetical protein